MQVNAAMLMKNLPPHLRNMIVKSGRAMPVHAAAAAAAQAGRQPAVGSPKVLPRPASDTSMVIADFCRFALLGYPKALAAHRIHLRQG